MYESISKVIIDGSPMILDQLQIQKVHAKGNAKHLMLLLLEDLRWKVDSQTGEIDGKYYLKKAVDSLFVRPDMSSFNIFADSGYDKGPPESLIVKRAKETKLLKSEMEKAEKLFK